MITWQVNADVSQAVTYLSSVQVSLLNPRPQLKIATDAIERRIRNTFQTQTAPWGAQWAPLASLTLALRAQRGSSSLNPLVDTRSMFNTLGYVFLNNTATELSMGGAAEVQQYGNPLNKVFGGPIGPIPARPTFPLRDGGVADLPTDWVQDILSPFQQLFRS